MKPKHLVSVLVLVAMGTSAGLSAAEPLRDEVAPLEAQPHMSAALALLASAKANLVAATPDKGGHRVKALAHTNGAITQTQKGIDYDNANSASVGDEVSRLEQQPRMEAALANLQGALAQLEKASHDKGGHRVKAIALVKLAVAEVKAGIKYDNEH